MISCNIIYYEIIWYDMTWIEKSLTASASRWWHDTIQYERWWCAKNDDDDDDDEDENEDEDEDEETLFVISNDMIWFYMFGYDVIWYDTIRYDIMWTEMNISEQKRT